MRTMKKSIFVCVLMVAALLSGCTKSELATPQGGDESGEIGVRSSVAGMVASTRQPYGTEATTPGNENLVANPLQALVVTSLEPHDYKMGVATDPVSEGTTKLYGYGKMTFKGEDNAKYEKPMDYGEFKFHNYGEPGATGEEKLHYMTGLYPYYAPWVYDALNGEFTLTLTGKEDVMLAPEVSTTYKAVKNAGKGSGTYAELSFAHQLTLLKLAFIKEDKDDFPITLKAIRVLSQKQTARAKISQASPEIVFEGNVISYPCYRWDTDNTVATVGDYDVPRADTNPDPYAYVLVPPVTASNIDGTDEYVFEYDYEDEYGDTKTDQEVGVNLGEVYRDATGVVDGSTKGKAYLITFKFTDGNCRCTAKATQWGTGPSSSFEI
jgi:hypothetical protein